MPTDAARPRVPAEIAAARRRQRARTIRVYGIIIALAVVLGGGALAVYGLYLQRNIDANSHLAAAVGDYTRGDLPAAEREARRSIAIKDDDYDAHFDLGIILLKEGRDAPALAEMRLAAGINDLPTPHLYAGIAALAMRRPDVARDEANRGLALTGHGQDPDLDAVLAMADARLGDRSGAARAYAVARASGYQGQTVRQWIAQATLTQD